MEETTGGVLSPEPVTTRMSRIRPLPGAVRLDHEKEGVVRAVPVGRVRVEEDEHGVRGGPVEDDAPDDGTWWGDAVRTYEGIEPIVLEPVEGTLLEGAAGTDPFVFWCRRVLHALAVAAATAGTIAWLLILIPVVRLCWSELWF